MEESTDMSPKLTDLATTGAALSSLIKDFPDVPELKVGLSLVLEELKREIKSVERKRAA